VSDLHEYLTEGQTVKVMVIGLEGGKINLSIKRTLPAPTRQQTQRPRGSFQQRQVQTEPAAAVRAAAEIVRRYAQAVHVRVGQQNVLHPRLFRPQDQDQKTITGKRPGAVSRAGSRANAAFTAASFATSQRTASAPVSAATAAAFSSSFS